MLAGNAVGLPGGDYVRTFSVVSPQADLKLSVAVDNPTPIEGGPVRYTITLDDLAGPQAANAVQVTERILSRLKKIGSRRVARVTWQSAAGDSSRPIRPVSKREEHEALGLVGINSGEQATFRSIMMREERKGHPRRKDFSGEDYR